MCLLIFKPSDKEIPLSHLSNGACQNPHGGGVAIATGDKLIIQKSAKWGAEEVNKVLEKWKGHPAIVHFRFATHGSKNYLNTHPFWLTDKWCAAHNGVISGINTLKDESDTRAFLRLHVKPLLKDGCSLSDKDIIQLLGEEMGNWNKMVYLSAEGDVGIANEDSGHWFGGIWYSNHNYEDWNYYGDYDEYMCERYPSSYYRYNMSQGNGGATAPPVPRLPYPSYPSREDNDSPPEDTGMPDYVPASAATSRGVWHRLDTNRMVCDVCDKPVRGECKLNADTGFIICEMCEFFHNNPTDI